MLKFVQNFNHIKNEKKINLTLDSMRKERDSNRVGYYKLPSTSREISDKINALHVEFFSQIVVIGVGGSSLGIKAVDKALNFHTKDVKEILYLENSDPISISKTLKKVKKDEALFFIISKSGNTIETLSIFKTIISHFKLDFKNSDRKKIFIITDSDSNLSSFAKLHNITQFNIPLNVGGRFSVLSAVGIAPLMMAGYDIDSLLNGAENFIESFFKGEEKQLLKKALFLSENRGKTPINVLFAYADNLENFTKWYIQLWAESLGKIDKNGKNIGLTPINLIGATDQHSFLQLIMQGVRDKTVTFIKVEDFANNLAIPDISLDELKNTDFANKKTFNRLINSQCDATIQSLIDTKIDTDVIILDFINPENIGTLIAYYELLTSATALMMGVDAYNQPGVELSKQILYKNLQN